MEYFKVDLYEYFGREKPENAKATLTCTLHEVISDISLQRKSPAMLVIPGGGYAECCQREAEPIATRFFSDGYNTFVLDYSVKPCVYPTAFQEAAMAMAYIRLEYKKLKIKQDNVAVVGFSAGGHLCGCLGAMFENECLDFLKENKQYVRPDAIILVYAVIEPYLSQGCRSTFCNLCGGENEEMYKELTLYNQVKPNSVPAFLVSTVGDKAAPCQNSLDMATAYNQNGVPFALHIYERGEHGMATVDRLTYHQDKNLKEFSMDCKGWIELALNWLSDDRRFHISH